MGNEVREILTSRPAVKYYIEKKTFLKFLPILCFVTLQYDKHT